MKKILFLLLLPIININATNYLVKLNDKNETKVISVQEYRNWNLSTSTFTEWINKNMQYDLTAFSPLINEQTEDFIQTQTAKQDQSQIEQKREFDTVKEVYQNVGDPINVEQTITVINERNIVVSFTNWNDLNAYYDCGTWSPLVNTIESGTTFTQSATCKQNQERNALYNFESNLLATKTFSQIINTTENQDALGTLITDQPFTLTCTQGTLNSSNKTCSYTNTISASASCPSGYSNYDATRCYYVSTRSYSSLGCPSGYRDTSGGCYKSVSKVKDTNCNSGYTYGKWKSGYCTDSSAYTTSQGRDCGNGTTSWWDSMHYICTYQSPHMYSAPYNCPATTSGSYCINTSDSRSYTYNCSSGYSWNGSTCTRTNITNKTYSCSGGYSLSGSTCSKYVTVAAIINCPSGFTYKSSEDVCKTN